MQTSTTRITVLSALLAATLAGAAESRTFIFRSVEDASTPPDPAVCASAPFAANVLLGGSLWWQQTSPFDGRTSARLTRRIGKATACVQLTNFTFPPGLDQNFYVAFDLPEGRFTASGSCKIISNQVPVVGLVLGGCSMSLTGWPQGYTGGAVVSLSTLNPFRLEGYNTGSTYVLQAYRAVDSNAEREQHLGRSLSYVELAELP